MNAHNDDLSGSESKPHSDTTPDIKTPPCTDYERLKRVRECDWILDDLIQDLTVILATKPVNIRKP